MKVVVNVAGLEVRASGVCELAKGAMVDGRRGGDWGNEGGLTQLVVFVVETFRHPVQLDDEHAARS